MNKVNICGVPYKIAEVDEIPSDIRGELVQGQIIYHEGKIYLRKSLPDKLKQSVLYHEWVHGMLVMIGRNDLSDNEELVCNIANAIFGSFDFKGGKNGSRTNN